MRTVRGAEADALLRIHDVLVQQLGAMASQGVSLVQFIQFLADRGTPKAAAHIVLRRAQVAGANEIRRVVYCHSA